MHNAWHKVHLFVLVSLDRKEKDIIEGQCERKLKQLMAQPIALYPFVVPHHSTFIRCLL